MVCESCGKRGITAKGVADAAKRLKRQLTCAACEREFPRQEHISSAQETEHMTKGRKVVCVDCLDVGFTARSWHAYECFGTCKRKLPKSQFVVGPNFARAYQNRTLKCKSCA